MPNLVTDPADFPGAFKKALNAGDLDGVLALYEGSATLRTRSGEVRSGEDAVRFETAQLVAAGARIANTLRHAPVGGDLALIIVDLTLRLETPDEPMQLAGTATNVLRRDPRGGLLMAISYHQGVA